MANGYEDVDERDGCERCGGAGVYHDCGEDSCSCEVNGRSDAEDDDLVMCPDCGGTGVR